MTRYRCKRRQRDDNAGIDAKIKTRYDHDGNGNRNYSFQNITELRQCGDSTSCRTPDVG